VTSECAVCGDDAAVSDACPHCGGAYCPAHRPPDAHDCPGTAAGTVAGWRLDLDGAERRTGRTDDSPSLASLLRPGVGLAALTLVVVALALGAVAAVGPFDDGLDTDAVESHIENGSDAARVEAGVGTTQRDESLATLARTHSRDMRDRGFVNHTNPDGEGPQDRADAVGIDCRVGENIYQTPRGAIATSERAFADHVVRSWLDSAGHRRTLLRERYTRQGVGVAVGEDAVYVTQLFC
jgi:hypothetical protein